jgi:hypothetical protein
MSGTRAPATPGETVEKYVTRIEAHLVRLAEGHDPIGHLFAIERLARAALSERWEAQRQTQPGRHGR